ncbi:unnamed protein product [Laminaria digitata]
MMSEGLATAFQCLEDGMAEKLASLGKEQSALLAKLEAARQALPLPVHGRTRYREPNHTDLDIEYIAKVMNQAPRYTNRVRALTAQKALLAARVVNLQRRSAGLRESLPAPLQLINTAELERLRSGSMPFQEHRDLAFLVCYQGGVAIRTSPSVDAPCVGEVLQWKEAFSASERLARLGEETIYVKLSDGRGWVFESLDGTRVLERVTPSSIRPPTPPSPPPSLIPPPSLRNGFGSDGGGETFSVGGGSAPADVSTKKLTAAKRY